MYLIAHRGFSAIAPENTLSAFRSAIGGGADGIECDVQLSCDRVPIIFHDPGLERTTNGRGEIKKQTLKQLKALDAGEWFGSEFAGEKIPTFQEVLDLIKETDIGLYAEVKQAHDWTNTDLDNLIETIINNNCQERITIASFNSNFIGRVRDRAAWSKSDRAEQIKLGYNVAEASEYPEILRQAGSKNKASILSEYGLLLKNPALIESTINQGIDLVAWTVDSQEDLQKLQGLGVERIITNSLLKR